MVGTEECRISHLPRPDQLAGAGDEEKGLRPADQLLVADELQEMKNSQSNTMEGGINPLVLDRDIEMEISPPTPPVEDGVISSSSATMIKERKLLDFDLKLSALLITVSTIPLIDTLFLHGPTAKLNLTLKFSAFAAFTALISAFCLLLNTIKLMAIKPEQFIPKSQFRASKILFGIAVGSLFLTCILITYSLLPKAYYFLPFALLPSLLVAGFHLLYRPKTDQGEIATAQSKAIKKALKRATQLTLSLVSTSFSGFIVVLLAIYHKAAILGAAYSYVKVSIYLLLGGGIAGAFALLLCRLLSGNGGDCQSSGSGGTTWQRAILAAGNIAMITMLVPAILMVAETILHGLLAGAVMFPVIAGVAAWLLVEFCTAEGSSCTETEDSNKAGHGSMYAVAVAVATVSFGAIIAIFAGMLGGAVRKEQLKACTFLLASAFVSAVSLGVAVTTRTVRAKAKAKASTEFAATVLACCGIGTFVLAALALFYQIAA
ncbi:unnamed protein product [Urochloa decumbens]|uniref:Uncharacterized protein n=1 Tax=Urochloa decumbens TaxID=240449 RepID=A0ABC9E058_9POAL